MTDTIEIPTPETHSDDESAVSLDALDHLFGARLHPVWWGSFRDAPHFADDETIAAAYEELADRVKGVAGLLWQSEIEPGDAVKAGQMLHELAREAETLHKLWRCARRQLREQRATLGSIASAPADEKIEGFVEHYPCSLDELREDYRTAIKACNDVGAVVDELITRLHILDGSSEVSALRALADGIAGLHDHPLGALNSMAQRLGIEQPDA